MHGAGVFGRRTQEDVALGVEPQTHRDEYFVRRPEAFGDVAVPALRRITVSLFLIAGVAIGSALSRIAVRYSSPKP